MICDPSIIKQASGDQSRLARKDSTSQASTRRNQEGTEGQVAGIPDELVNAAGAGIVYPTQSPLYHAENAQRYERQALISTYEQAYSCRLVNYLALTDEASGPLPPSPAFTQQPVR